jgi:hypothetical protein
VGDEFGRAAEDMLFDHGYKFDFRIFIRKSEQGRITEDLVPHKF